MAPFALYLYGLDGGPLLSSFEEASQRLQQLERLYWEPDGSFTWVAEPGKCHQVDGMLYDAAGRLQYVDLKGNCSLLAWRMLIESICPSRDCPPEQLRVLQLRNGVLQQLQQFERERWDLGGRSPE